MVAIRRRRRKYKVYNGFVSVYTPFPSSSLMSLSLSLVLVLVLVLLLLLSSSLLMLSSLLFSWLLVAAKHLYKRVCSSVGPSVRPCHRRDF